MSEERLEPLDAELAALVDAERARPDLPAGAEGRLLERLERSIANADDAGGGPGRGGGGESGGGVGGGSGGVGGAGRLARFFSRRLPFGVTAFALGGLAGAGLHAVVRRPPPPAPPPIVERAPAPSPTAAATPASPAAAPPASPAAAPDVAAPGGSPEAAAPRRRPIRPAPAPARPARDDEGEPDTELAAERALVETARTAMARGDLAGALETLQRGARRFPEGRLVEERESLRIQALAKAGRGPEARALASKFHKQFPNSMLLPMIDEALQSIP